MPARDLKIYNEPKHVTGPVQLHATPSYRTARGTGFTDGLSRWENYRRVHAAAVRDRVRDRVRAAAREPGDALGVSWRSGGRDGTPAR